MLRSFLSNEVVQKRSRNVKLRGSNCDLNDIDKNWPGFLEYDLFLFSCLH